MPYTLLNDMYGWNPTWNDKGLLGHYFQQLETIENVCILAPQTNRRVDGYFLDGFDNILSHLRTNNYQKIIFTSSDQAWLQIATQVQKMLVDEFGDRVWTITSANVQDSQTISFLFYWYAAVLVDVQKDFPHWTPNYSIIGEPKKYKAGCLNNRSAWHRVIFLDMIYNKPYFKEILYSLNELFIYPHSIETFIGPHEKIYIQTAKKYLDIAPINLDLSKAGWDTKGLGIDHPAYTDSYLNIITENSYEETFLSEKTFKPLASGQLFLIYSGPGSIQFLRDLGFDVFDDYIDHSYDLEQDWIKRGEKITKELDKWFAADHEKIWQETYSRRLANAEKFFNLDTSTNPFKKIFR
jgi:hypothetical protein